ncbi:MAG: hypothetical protein AB7G21_15270 [Dehalococcoidia bacterium]
MHDFQDSTRLAAYVFVAAVCTIGAIRQPSGRRTAQVILIAVALTALAVAFAESVNLGERISNAFRAAAGEEGWYEGRRPLQAAIITGIAATGLTVTAVAARAAWRADRRLVPVVLLGLLVLTLIAARTVSLHQVDDVLYDHTRGGLHLGSAIEIGVAFTLAAWVAACFVVAGPGSSRRVTSTGQ